ncbi:MAG: GNAT family N-acetyltransferase [Terriglobia bacterium]
MIRLYRDEEAVALLQEAAFLRQWTALYAACSHGTCFQDVPFVTAWYQIYGGQFEPLIVAGGADADALGGLLFLAVSKKDGAIVQVGGEQAEYHAWLARDGEPEGFIELALDRLAEEFPRGRLQFLFLPPKTPLVWSDRWLSRCEWRAIARPLLSTEPGNEIAEVLRKKKKKMRLNQLERLGELSFDRIRDPEAFETALDEIIPFYDFRQGAMYGAPPFASDALKKPFYMAMMRQPGLLHVTVLRLDGRIISAHIGPRNKNQVVLGVIVQSPFLSRHSLGRIHILFLGLHLQEEGLSAVDLTPGGGYKEELASHHDEAYVLTVFFHRPAARRYRMRRSLVTASKRFVFMDRMKKLGERIRPRLKLIKASQLPAAVCREIKSAVWSRKDLRVYCLDVKSHPTLPGPTIMRRDHLADLLLYEPADAGQPAQQEVWEKALERLEDGYHVYTHVLDGRLIHYGWLIENHESCPLDEVSQALACAPNSTALLNFYTHPRFREKGLFRSSLRQMLADAVRSPQTQQIYISLLSHDATARRIVEEAGFRRQESYFKTTRFGKTTRGRDTTQSDT